LKTVRRRSNLQIGFNSPGGSSNMQAFASLSIVPNFLPNQENIRHNPESINLARTSNEII
jgi:hypothetical protein